MSATDKLWQLFSATHGALITDY